MITKMNHTPHSVHDTIAANPTWWLNAPTAPQPISERVPPPSAHLLFRQGTLLDATQLISPPLFFYSLKASSFQSLLRFIFALITLCLERDLNLSCLRTLVQLKRDQWVYWGKGGASSHCFPNSGGMRFGLDVRSNEICTPLKLPPSSPGVNCFATRFQTTKRLGITPRVKVACFHFRRNSRQ